MYLSGFFHGKEVSFNIIYRDIRNSKGRLLCKANDQSGMVETEGSHKSVYKFNIPIGGSFTVTRENIISRVTRTKTTFIVEDTAAA